MQSRAVFHCSEEGGNHCCTVVMLSFYKLQNCCNSMEGIGQLLTWLMYSFFPIIGFGVFMCLNADSKLI